MTKIPKPLLLAAALILAPMTTWGDDNLQDPASAEELASEPCFDVTMGGIVPAPDEAAQPLTVAASAGAEGRSVEPANAGESAGPDEGAGLRMPGAAMAERLRRPE